MLKSLALSFALFSLSPLMAAAEKPQLHVLPSPDLQENFPFEVGIPRYTLSFKEWPANFLRPLMGSYELRMHPTDDFEARRLMISNIEIPEDHRVRIKYPHDELVIFQGRNYQITTTGPGSVFKLNERDLVPAGELYAFYELTTKKIRNWNEKLKEHEERNLKNYERVLTVTIRRYNPEAQDALVFKGEYTFSRQAQESTSLGIFKKYKHAKYVHFPEVEKEADVDLFEQFRKDFSEFHSETDRE